MTNGYVCLNNEYIKKAYLTHAENYSTIGMSSSYSEDAIEILNYPQPIDNLKTMPKNRMGYFYNGSRTKVAVSITKNGDTDIIVKYEIINPGDIVVAIGNQNYFDGCSIADIKYNYVIIHKNVRECGLQTISEEFNSDSSKQKKLAVFSSEDAYENIPYIMHQSDIVLNGRNSLSGINELNVVNISVSSNDADTLGELTVIGNASISNTVETNTVKTDYISPRKNNESLSITNSPKLIKNLTSEKTTVSDSIIVSANTITENANTIKFTSGNNSDSSISMISSEDSSEILIASPSVNIEGPVRVGSNGSGELYGSGNLTVGASSTLGGGSIDVQNTESINISGEVRAIGDKTKLSVYEIVPNSLNKTVDIADNLHVIASYVQTTDSAKDSNKTYYEKNGDIYTVAVCIPNWNPEQYYERKESIITGNSLTTENIAANNANVKKITVETSADIASASIKNAEITGGSITTDLTAGNLVIDAAKSVLTISDSKKSVHTTLSSNGLSADLAKAGELVTASITSEGGKEINIGSSIKVNGSISGVTKINSDTGSSLTLNQDGITVKVSNNGQQNELSITSSDITASSSQTVDNFVLGQSMYAGESYKTTNYKSAVINNSTNRVLFIDNNDQIRSGVLSEIPNVRQIGSSISGISISNDGSLDISSNASINLSGNTNLKGDLSVEGTFSAKQLKIDNVINITKTDLSTSDDLIELGMTRNGDDIDYSTSPYVGIYSYRSNSTVAQLNNTLSGNGAIKISDISTTKAPESLLDLIKINSDSETTVKSDVVGGRTYQDVESGYKPLLGPYYNATTKKFESQLAIYYVSAENQNDTDNLLNNLSISEYTGIPSVLNIVPVKDSSGNPVYLSRGFFIDNDGQCRVGIAYNSGLDDSSSDEHTSCEIIDNLSGDSLQYILTRSEIIKKNDGSTEKTLNNNVKINDMDESADSWSNDYSQAPGLITALNMMTNRMEAANYSVKLSDSDTTPLDGFKIESGKLHVGVASENEDAHSGFGLISALTRVNIDSNGIRTFTASSSSGYASGLNLIDGKLGLNIATDELNGTVHIKPGNGLDIAQDGEVSFSTATDDGVIGAITVCKCISPTKINSARFANSIALAEETSADEETSVPESGLTLLDGELYLKAATASTNGSVKVTEENGLKISDGGVISMSAASDTECGAVKVNAGNGLSYEDNVIKMNIASDTECGAVKVNAGNGLSYEDNVIKMNIASDTECGAVKVNAGNGLSYEDNVIKMNAATNTSLGAVSVTSGNGLSYEDNVIKMNAATNTSLGAVSVTSGNGLSYEDNVIKMNAATNTSLGAVSVTSGNGLSYEDNVIKMNAATNTSLGAVSVTSGNGLSYEDNVIKMNAATNTSLGAVSVTSGNGLSYEDNVIKMNAATNTSLGAVSVTSGNGLSYEDNVIKMNAATNTSLGAVSVTSGNGLSYEDNVIKMNAATNTSLGAVSVTSGNGLSITNGNISMAVASADNAGAVKPNFDGSFITYDSTSGSMSLASYPTIKSLYVTSSLAVGADMDIGIRTALSKSAIEFIYCGDGMRSNLMVTTSSQMSVSIPIVSTKEIKAASFNATSDERLKTNITALDYSALDIVNDMKTYSFEYKSDPDTHQIGVIAQELEDKKIGDFSFVSEDADGYLSVKESKLVYLLIKAVQEQQKEIEELKRKINGED